MSLSRTTCIFNIQQNIYGDDIQPGDSSPPCTCHRHRHPELVPPRRQSRRTSLEASDAVHPITRYLLQQCDCRAYLTTAYTYHGHFLSISTVYQDTKTIPLRGGQALVIDSVTSGNRLARTHVTVMLDQASRKQVLLPRRCCHRFFTTPQ